MIAPTAFLIYRKDSAGTMIYRATRLTLQEATAYKLRQPKADRGLYEIVAYQIRPQWQVSVNAL